MINIKFGRCIHWHSKNVHVYFQVPIFRIFGLMAKNTFLQFYMHISYTNRPIDMKYGMLVHCNNMYIYVNFQLSTCYIFCPIAKKCSFPIILQGSSYEGQPHPTVVSIKHTNNVLVTLFSKYYLNIK